MKINKQDLKNHLSAMLEMAKLAKKQTMPIFRYIRVSAKNGEAVFSQTDLENWLTVKISVVGAEADFLIPAKEFLDFVKSAKTSFNLERDGQKITLETAEGTKKTISCDMPLADYPAWSVLPPLNFHLLPDNFTGALKEVDNARSDDESRKIINGVAVEFSPEEILLIATDGHTLAKKSMPAMAYDFNGVIPGSSLPILYKISGQLSHASFLNPIPEHHTAHTFNQTGYQIFKSGGLELIVFDQRSKFPNWRQVIKTGEHKITLDRKLVLDFCNNVFPLYKGIKYPSYMMKIAKLGDKLHLSAQTANGEISTAIDYSYPNMSDKFHGFFIGISAKLLKNALAVEGDEGVFVFLTDYLNPIAIVSDTVHQMIMPMRLTDRNEHSLAPALEPMSEVAIAV